jgi:hypothetical protein
MLRRRGKQTQKRPSAVEPVLWKPVRRCPTCGAGVDEASADHDPNPRCQYCDEPLPCEPLASLDTVDRLCDQLGQLVDQALHAALQPGPGDGRTVTRTVVTTK